MQPSDTWADLVCRRRKALCISIRSLARAVGVSHWYIREMELYGDVPRRGIVLRVAEALQMNSDGAMLVAGYAPITDRVFAAAMIEALARKPEKLQEAS